MKKLMLSAGLLVMLFAALSCAATRAGVVTMEFDLSSQKAGEEVRLWIPYPVSDRHQLITGVTVTGDFSSSAVYTDRIFGTPMLYAQWPKEAESRKLSFSFNVERQEISLRNLPTKEPAWNRNDYAEFLKPTSLGPIDGDVKTLAASITKGKKTNVAKARAIYDWTVDNMYRDPNTLGCGAGNVCELLKKPGGKCTDISSVFIALCRAVGVPAREVFSVRLGKKPLEDITGYQHCWAEFFIPGFGWVPADPADVRKAMLVEKLQVADPKAKEYREYFWGGIDAYRVTIGSGRDVMLSPPQAGSPLNTFGYPYAEVGGNIIDWLDAKTFRYRFTFTEK